MIATVKAVTARIPRACDSCYSCGRRGPVIIPGHRYLRHVTFPNIDTNQSSHPIVHTECVACACERDPALGTLDAGACATSCCGDTPCAMPFKHDGGHSCLRCADTAVPQMETITRPDGRLYRSQKVAGYPVTDDGELVCGIMVLGTHDTDRAKPLADRCAALWVDGGYVAASPVTGWWRDGFEGGRRCWVTDPVRGRAGVWFREIAEHASPVVAG